MLLFTGPSRWTGKVTEVVYPIWKVSLELLLIDIDTVTKIWANSSALGFNEDSVIRMSSVQKLKATAIAISLFMTLSVLMGAYVFYLHANLSCAQINLAASAEPLT